MRHGAAYIEELITHGEHERQDFKFRIADSRKIARSIAAFANHAGGRLLIGVKDNGIVAGVSSEEEIYMVEQAASMYCRPPQPVEFVNHNVHGKIVVEAIIGIADTRPVTAPDEHGNYVAYYRVADENVVVGRVHERVMSESGAATISLGERERRLLDYIGSHGAITVKGATRLLHCSDEVAEQIVVAMCRMGIAEIDYHDNNCVITLTK